MNWTRSALTVVAVGATLLGTAGLSRAQLSRTLAAVQGPVPGGPTLAGIRTPLYALAPAHRGVRLELSAISWGISGPAFLAEVVPTDPSAPAFLDLDGAAGSVTVNGRTASFVPFGPTADHPRGGLRAVVPPEWSSWLAAPWQGQDVAFELRRAGESQPTLAGSATDLRR